MRRLILIGIVAALAAAVLAPTAGARSESTFKVIADSTSHKERKHAFILKGKLRDPNNRSNVVGHFRAPGLQPSDGRQRRVGRDRDQFVLDSPLEDSLQFADAGVDRLAARSPRLD